MSHLSTLLILYVLTGVIFVAYDFKFFQKIYFYTRVLFSPGGVSSLMITNPKLYQTYRSLYDPVDTPFYVSGSRYGIALLSVFLWPFTPRILPPWFFLRKNFRESMGIKLLLNLYLVPIFLLVIVYVVSVWGFIEYGAVWQKALAAVLFSGVIWLLCRRRDKKVGEWREKRTNGN